MIGLSVLPFPGYRIKPVKWGQGSSLKFFSGIQGFGGGEHHANKVKKCM